MAKYEKVAVEMASKQESVLKTTLTFVRFCHFALTGAVNSD